MYQLQSMSANSPSEGILTNSNGSQNDHMTWANRSEPIGPLEATTQNEMTCFGSSRFQTISMN